MSLIEKNEEEIQYLNLLNTIIEKGILEKTRNGNCLTIFGHQQKFSLKEGKIPILTTRKISFKIAFHELMFFIRGQTNIRYLHQNNVHIWDANSTKEFLDSRGLNYPVGELGPIYGAQWRNFNGNSQMDQLQDVINQLKDPEKRTSRRIIMTAWNPLQLDKMALPPCHILCQFHVKDGKYLSCVLFQRSMDTVLGCPTNIITYSLLTHILAKHCDLDADEFIHFIGNAHIYEEHLEDVKKQLERTPLAFPSIIVKHKKENIEDYEINDIEFITPYCSLETIKYKMIA
jgi:thymidylate synthase